VVPAEPLFAKLSDKIGGADRDRTDDLRLAKPALSQLSYSPAKNDFSPDYFFPAFKLRINDRSATNLASPSLTVIATRG
jgi:hypothetical protein